MTGQTSPGSKSRCSAWPLLDVDSHSKPKSTQIVRQGAQTGLLFHLPKWPRSMSVARSTIDLQSPATPLSRLRPDVPVDAPVLQRCPPLTARWILGKLVHLFDLRADCACPPLLWILLTVCLVITRPQPLLCAIGGIASSSLVRFFSIQR